MVLCRRIGKPRAMYITPWQDLRCHDATPATVIRTFQVALRRTSDELKLRFRIDGSIPRISLTPQNTRQNSADLWRHTCFEVFVARDGRSAYHEFNFAPSGAWRVYAFRAYRDPAPLVATPHEPAIKVRIAPHSLELDASITLKGLFAVYSHSTLRLGLSAVIELHGGPLSYWALCHRPGKPDFHHPDTFAMRIEAPEPE